MILLELTANEVLGIICFCTFMKCGFEDIMMVAVGIVHVFFVVLQET